MVGLLGQITMILLLIIIIIVILIACNWIDGGDLKDLVLEKKGKLNQRDSIMKKKKLKGIKNARDKEATQYFFPWTIEVLGKKGNVVEKKEISSEGFTIGRNEECDLQLNSKRVGRYHAEICRDGDKYYIKDLNSKNGTFEVFKDVYNKNRFEKEKKNVIVLYNGVLVAFADCVCRFKKSDWMDEYNFNETQENGVENEENEENDDTFTYYNL